VGGCTRRSTPGFYFAAVISGEWRREEVPQGISEASRKATKTRGKIPAQAGETELEGEIAQRDRIRPTRQVPSQLIWRDREAVKFERAILKGSTGHSDGLGRTRSLTTERLASPRR